MLLKIGVEDSCLPFYFAIFMDWFLKELSVFNLLKILTDVSEADSGSLHFLQLSLQLQGGKPPLLCIHQELITVLRFLRQRQELILS